MVAERPDEGRWFSDSENPSPALSGHPLPQGEGRASPAISEKLIPALFTYAIRTEVGYVVAAAVVMFLAQAIF